MKVEVDKFTVIRNQVILKPIAKAEQKTASGIIIPGIKKNEKLEVGEVIGVGYEVNNELVNNNLPPLTNKDKVIYDITYCSEVTMDTTNKEQVTFVVIDFAHVKFIL